MREKPIGRNPVMYQTWKHLLFLHWEIDAAIIQQTLPKGLHADIFEGKAYIGLVPFFMKNIRPVFFPAVPGISNFLETNVRTYVHDEKGVPGVWFFSLDANQSLAVWLARTFFKLPYYRAKMSAEWNAEKDKLLYKSKRKDKEKTSIFEYATKGKVKTATLGTLEFFLLERYILFSWNKTQQKLMKGQVVHSPYQFMETRVSQWDNELLQLNQFEITGSPELMHYAPGVDVHVYAIERV